MAKKLFPRVSCETLLSMLPTMSLTYHLLRQYHITPIESGVINRRNRICLKGLVVLRGGVLYVPTTRVHRVFIPFGNLPSSGRRQVIRLLKFLETVSKGNLQTIKTKCAKILVSEYVDQLVQSQIISSSRVLTNPYVLINAGGGVRSIISCKEYAKKAFDYRHLPLNSHLHEFLKLSIDLTSEDEILDEIAG